MQITVNGEQPFKSQKGTFCVAGTTNGYTLNYSADKENWTAYEEDTPANETLIVNGVTPYMWFKLAGNTDEETLIIV